MDWKPKPISAVNSEELSKFEITQNVSLRQIAKSYWYIRNEEIKERTKMITVKESLS